MGGLVAETGLALGVCVLGVRVRGVVRVRGGVPVRRVRVVRGVGGVSVFLLAEDLQLEEQLLLLEQAGDRKSVV